MGTNRLSATGTNFRRRARLDRVPHRGIGGAILLPLLYIYIAGLWRSRHQAEWRSIIIFSAFTLLYLIIIIAGAVLGNTEFGIQARYLFPLYIPLLAAAALFMDAFISHSKAGNTPESIACRPIIGLYARWRINAIPLPRRRIDDNPLPCHRHSIAI